MEKELFIIKMAKKKEKEYILIKMVIHMMETGITAKKKEKEHILI